MHGCSLTLLFRDVQIDGLLLRQAQQSPHPQGMAHQAIDHIPPQLQTREQGIPDQAITTHLPLNVWRRGPFPSKTGVLGATVEGAGSLTSTCARAQVGIWLPSGSSQGRVAQETVSLRPWLRLGPAQQAPLKAPIHSQASSAGEARLSVPLLCPSPRCPLVPPWPIPLLTERELSERTGERLGTCSTPTALEGAGGRRGCCGRWQSGERLQHLSAPRLSRAMPRTTG